MYTAPQAVPAHILTGWILNPTSYTDTGLSASAACYYKASVYNNYVESAKSALYGYATTSSSGGSSGTGSVKVVNSSSYSNDPIYVELSKYAGNTMLGSIIIDNNSNYTFTNVPAGVSLRVGAMDDYYNVSGALSLRLHPGKQKQSHI
jgi:hypothetical protein